MKTLEHDDYTPFEYACQLGNIPGLKLIFSHQQPQENNSIYLNGLLQSIAANQLEVTTFLFQQPGYHRILEKHQKEIILHIQEHGHYHLLEILDDILTLQLPLPMEELIQPLSLDMPEQIVLQALSAYYQSTICQKTASQHLEEIQKQLATLYQQQPIDFPINSNDHISLPLTWEAFQVHRSSFDDNTQKKMQQAYLQNPIHSAWRFFLKHDAWSSPSRNFNAHHADIRWMLILMWTVAHDPYLLNPQEVLSLEERITLFISELAHLHHHQWHDQLLQKFLIHSVLGHPLTKILDSVQLRHEHQTFIQSIWEQHLNSLNIETLLQIQIDWSHFLLHPQTEIPPSLLGCRLSDTDNQLFEKNMCEKWGARWSDNLALIQESRKNLLSMKSLILFKDSFQQAIDVTLDQIRSIHFQQFNFFYHDDLASAIAPLDHHQKIN